MSERIDVLSPSTLDDAIQWLNRFRTHNQPFDFQASKRPDQILQQFLYEYPESSRILISDFEAYLQDITVEGMVLLQIWGQVFPVRLGDMIVHGGFKHLVIREHPRRYFETIEKTSGKRWPVFISEQEISFYVRHELIDRHSQIAFEKCAKRYPEYIVLFKW